MKRCKYEIYRDILACCYKGEIKSQMMTKCGLSWQQTKEMLQFLINQGFLEVVKRERPDNSGHMKVMTVYQTTHKGVVLLMALENVDFMLKTDYANNTFRHCHVATATP